MNRNQEEDEFIAVRVQDPRVQNEGSWNSYVDYKIFLHTNSKAFTAKTSCVRRRYSEFVWLKKKLQKNAGLVPVPDLPGKSFFTFSNEDFLERRRKGLQVFLDKVVHMTVCLSDSQLHLFLQTQLPACHIQDCVQGHTPYSVTDAILTYASSNWGLAQAQAQEDESLKEPSLTVSYESMESPAPHQPCLQSKETSSPELLSCGDSDPLAGLLEPRRKEKPSVTISQRNNHLEAIFERERGPAEATFYLGGGPDDPDRHGPVEQTSRGSCRIQTPVEVHSPMGTGFEEECREREEEEGIVTSDTDEETVHLSDVEVEAVQMDGPGGADIEKVSPELEECPAVVLDFKSRDCDEQVADKYVRSQEEVCSEKQNLENHVISEVLSHIENAESLVSDVQEPNGQKERDDNESYDSGRKEETPPQSGVRADADDASGVPEVDCGDAGQQVDQNRAEEEADAVVSEDESDEDGRSLPSSNGSIVKVTDEESLADETEDSTLPADGYVKTSPEDGSRWSEVEPSGGNVSDLQMNGRPADKEDVSAQEDEDLTALDVSAAGGDLTESSDFSVLESSRMSGAAERDTPSSPPGDASEETHEARVRW